jgi:hypothetical protein
MDPKKEIRNPSRKLMAGLRFRLLLALAALILGWEVTI